MRISGKNIALVRYLATISSKESSVSKNIFKSVDKNFIHFLGEIALNILVENIIISDKEAKRLAPFVSLIRKIGSKSINSKNRRNLCIANPTGVCLMLKVVLPDLEVRHKEKRSE